MLTVVTIVHVIFCLLLIALVLLQDPKNAGVGGVFGGGGGSNSLLGATGAVTFLTKLTRYSAIIFGITSLTLSLLSKPNTSSVIDAAPAQATVPTAPVGQTQAPEQNPAMKDPKQAGTEAAPAQGNNVVDAKSIRDSAKGNAQPAPAAPAPVKK